MRRYWLVVLAIAACKGNVKTETKTESHAAVAPTLVDARAAPDGFGDWVAITPSEDRLRCASYAKDEWEVLVDAGTARAKLATEREPNRGPQLPFALPKGEAFRGRRHVVATRDGFIVGHDAGEWGGSLYWFSSDGKRQRELAKENVAGLVAIGKDAVLALEGLAHLGINEGRARWLFGDDKGWRETAVVPLDGAARVFVLRADGTYVVTTKSLTRIDNAQQAHVVQPLRGVMLYPNSMVADANGRLFIGMRQLVLRLTPKDSVFTEQWFAPRGCAEAAQRDHDCVCLR